MRRLIALAFFCVLLAACAWRGPVARPQVELPPLRLSPASLGKSLSLQQHLSFVFGEQRRDMDALLEVDVGEVRLLVQAMGQSGVRLSWDGKELRQQRAPWLPPAVRGERVLDDLQFALWPADAIRAVLPSGWTLDESDGVRSLRRDGRAWLRASGDAASGRAMLENLAEGYRLEIESTPIVQVHGHYQSVGAALAANALDLDLCGPEQEHSRPRPLPRGPRRFQGPINSVGATP